MIPRVSADDTDHQVLSALKSDMSVIIENVPGFSPVINGVRGEYASVTVPITSFSKITLNRISELLGINEKVKNGASKILLTAVIGIHLYIMFEFVTTASFVDGEKTIRSVSEGRG